MHDQVEVREVRTPELPQTAWALGWTFVAGQVLQLVEEGPQVSDAWPLSVLFGMSVVAFFSYGVLRARMVRFVLVVVLMVVASLGDLLLALDDPGVEELMALALTVAQLGLLVSFSRSPWFAWQRTRPEHSPSVVPVLALALVVGALGGVVGAEASAFHVDVRV